MKELVNVPYGDSGGGTMTDPRIKNLIQLIWEKVGYGTTRQELRADNVVEICFWSDAFTTRLQEVVHHDQLTTNTLPMSNNRAFQIVTFPLSAVPEIEQQLAAA